MRRRRRKKRRRRRRRRRRSAFSKVIALVNLLYKGTIWSNFKNF
jgi:hypothetical protein